VYVRNCNGAYQFAAKSVAENCKLGAQAVGVTSNDLTVDYQHATLRGDATFDSREHEWLRQSLPGKFVKPAVLFH
jgi:hypothetical protein